MQLLTNESSTKCLGKSYFFPSKGQGCKHAALRACSSIFKIFHIQEGKLLQCLCYGTALNVLKSPSIYGNLPGDRDLLDCFARYEILALICFLSDG